MYVHKGPTIYLNHLILTSRQRPCIIPLPARLLLLLFLLRSARSAAYSVGVNYGTVADNLPPPSQVANFLKTQTTITKVKIFDANPDILRAFAGTGISLTVTVPTGDIPSLTKFEPALSWVSNNILLFLPGTNIERISVGNEVIDTHNKTLIAYLLRAMTSLSSALARSGVNTTQVSTTHSLGILSSSDPPSSGRFRKGYDRAIFAPILQYHRETKSPFMVNPYPYFGFTGKTLNYALFKQNDGVYDSATGMKYDNMFAAQMDAVYSAMKKLGYEDVDIVVAETGWPSRGDPNTQTEANMENAVSYNGNLVKYVRSGVGTPLMPNRTFETYVFSLFNEDLKESVSEQNFGLFRPDFTPVYDVGILRGGGHPVPEPSGGPVMSPEFERRWCVPKWEASKETLQGNIDFVCSAGVDCAPIQDGGPCFQPNTVRSHASYTMNAFYQANGRNDFDCDFAQTGAIVTSDPSYEACKYAS